MSSNIGSNLSLACTALEKGEIVAFPTETVYGLGADATNKKAIARIFEMKGRPSFNPLICHIHDIGAAKNIAHVDDRALKVMEFFWPGPLTVVLPLQKNSLIAKNVCGGLDTIALRIPAHDVALNLLKMFDKPIAAPSANKSGEITLLRSQDVWNAFHEFQDFNILEGQTPYVGLESTILDLSQNTPLILRSGFITAENIQNVLGVNVEYYISQDDTQVRAPGMMLRHYAPKRNLRLDTAPVDGELYLGFGDVKCDLNLSLRGDLVEAAANVYIMIKDLDDIVGDFQTIGVAPIPHVGIGIAINDRLRRASGFYDKR